MAENFSVSGRAERSEASQHRVNTEQRMSEPSSMQYKQMECSVIERYSVTFFAEPNFPTLCSYTCKWIDGSLSMNCLES